MDIYVDKSFTIIAFHFLVLCINGDLRLVNGPTIQAGRLEICWNETWGTVCDNGWLQQDAVIACRQLGLNTRSMGIHY